MNFCFKFAAVIALAYLLAVQDVKSTLLTEYLFNTSRYDKRIIPSTGSHGPMNVSMGFTLAQIENLDEKRQVLISHVVLTLEWIDPMLSWKPSEYGETKYISVEASKVWKPDIVLYHSIDTESPKGMWRNDVQIQYDGLVVIRIPKIIHSSCETNVANYPFDKQECSLTFGSWAYHGFDLALFAKESEEDSSKYVKSGEWELEQLSFERHSIVYSCCPEPYYDITYTLKLRRQVLYYAMYYIIPCALIALLTATIFVLPHDCSERITVGMSALVGLSFFFLLVCENMPASSNVPLIGGYYSVTLIQMGISFFMNILVLRFHHMTDDPVPDWVRKFILGYAASFLKMKCHSNAAEEVTGKLRKKDIGLKPGEKRYTFPKEVLHADKKIVKSIKEYDEGIRRDIEWKQAAHVLNSWAFILHVLMVVFAFAVMFFEVLFIAKS